MSTAYHAKYFAHELTRHSADNGIDRLSMALFNASVDLNPHQIEAALFALRSPLSKGVILADEVGLGKTIEAGLVLCQYWAERRRRLLVVCPASIRKQWSLELEEKFNLPTFILDKRSYNDLLKAGNSTPFEANAVIICSINFASRMREELRSVNWDLAVIDEAHKLRGAHRASNKMGQAIKWALADTTKLLLTATPLQNSLIELYGLSTIIDEHIFGEVSAFRSLYMGKDADLDDLRSRLKLLCKRTLRNDVLEYINYTERKAITCPFRATNDEQKLYEAISAFLVRDDTYSIPMRQRQLTTLILRKLLASSSYAIAGTIDTMKSRLEALRDGLPEPESLAERVIAGEEIEDDAIDEALLDDVPDEEELDDAEADDAEPEIDRQKLKAEIEELDRYATWARSIGVDTKTRALLKALKIGFAEMAAMNPPAGRKAIIFTESRRTQNYLKSFLETNGYAGKIVVFNGTNSDPESKAIMNAWMEKNTELGRASGSRDAVVRTALIEHFRDNAEIMIATEAAAEGINLQFCSLVINYDLPWNPQRIEQRIGRCHRYGQEHDVVVINFLNERNEADRRVLELLAEKFQLFSGVFGASDEVLGTIESGVDFEKRVLAIYQQCRTPEEIQTAFQALQEEMDTSIQSRMEDTRKALLEHFDEDVHERLRIKLDETRQQLDKFSRMFWLLTKYMLDGRARFDDSAAAFDLHSSPLPQCPVGRYHLISKDHGSIPSTFLYRLSHPLGEHVIETGKVCPSPVAEVVFDITNHPTQISVIKALKGSSGWLALQRLEIKSFQKEEYILFSGFDSKGHSLDQEICEKLFHCDAKVIGSAEADMDTLSRLLKEAERHKKATINQSLEANNRFFTEERERLENWAEAMIFASEKELKDTKEQIKVLRRQARQAATVEDEHAFQLKIREMEQKQRRQRQRIFDIEDEIAEKRDTLIAALEKRLAQRTSDEHLFTIRWRVI